ncbi:hypothetical protein FZEAL_5400 [Fusarium zealandicum]|uniref:Reverse transcriptase domain-containing protein n=1 Tax=Fusarium zealandicum TaxID=1053134 RepID=A0A8H4UJQ9_9HYPO|nr:hypothetical protein FZEAL_5400 [Fusarium zealandicum]
MGLGRQIRCTPIHPSEHRAIQTSLNVELYRDGTKHFLRYKTPRKPYLAAIVAALARLEYQELQTPERIDAHTLAIRDAVLHAMQKCVPTRPACPPRPHQPASAAVRSVVQTERQPRTLLNPRKGRGWARFWKRWANQVLGEEGRKKTNSWRRYVPNKAKNARGVYNMARLARRVCQPRDKARIPALVSGGVTYATEEEKGSYLEEVEVDRVIRGLPSGKAAGDDDMANEALKMARIQLVPILTRLFRACLRLSHHPAMFKHAITVILPKADKDAYNEPKSWRPIALLPAMGKLLEKIMADRLKNLALEHKLLPDSQYGAAGKSTSSAVHDLLKPVYAAWNRKMRRSLTRKATLMGLDISGAFDNIDRAKLLEMLIAKRLPRWIIIFIWSFLSNRTTVLKMPGSTSKSFFVNIGIPQGSPLSPILFLFFAAPILNDIHKTTRNSVTIYAVAYVDDTYLLAVSDGYEANCKRLEEVHTQILEWARGVGVTFSPHKYNVMHFKNPRLKEPDCKLLPKIPGLSNSEKCPQLNLKILGVWVDHKLQWNRHIQHIEEKVNKQLRYLRRISGTIWGLSLKAARQIYLTKIRPTISYACAAWFVYSPGEKLNWPLGSWNLKRLDALQYKCLRQISGALGKASARVLEKELHIESIRVFLYRLMLNQRAKPLTVSRRSPYVDAVYQTPKKVAPKTHPYEVLDQKARDLCVKARDHLARNSDGDANVLAAKWLDPKKRQNAVNTCAKQDAAKMSAEMWDDYRRKRAIRHRESHRPQALTEAWGPESFRYYAGLSRAQSTMLLQCRTEFIGLNHFLHQRDLASSAACSCGHSKQTVFHMFVQCADLRAERVLLRQELAHTDFKRLMTENGAVVADWAISYFNLDQFVWPRLHSRFRALDNGSTDPY